MIRRTAILSAAILFTVSAMSAFSEPVWNYRENVNEMDDSVYRHVWAFGDSDDLWGWIGCESPGLIHVRSVGNYKYNFDADPGETIGIVLRFDKSLPITPARAFRSDTIPDTIVIYLDETVPLMLENAVLRVGIPVSELGSLFVLRFDLLDFNRAWDKCGGIESISVDKDPNEPSYINQVLEDSGEHSGRTTRNDYAIQNLDLVGLWRAVDGTDEFIIRVFPDGISTIAMDSSDCIIGHITVGWHYSDGVFRLVLGDEEDEGLVVSTPQTDRKIGQRVVFQDGGFMEFISPDPNSGCSEA